MPMNINLPEDSFKSFLSKNMNCQTKNFSIIEQVMAVIDPPFVLLILNEIWYNLTRTRIQWSLFSHHLEDLSQFPPLLLSGVCYSSCLQHWLTLGLHFGWLRSWTSCMYYSHLGNCLLFLEQREYHCSPWNQMLSFPWHWRWRCPRELGCTLLQMTTTGMPFSS